VITLYPNFEETDEETSKAMLDLSRYNCYFIEDMRIVTLTQWQLLLTDSPFLLRRFFSYFTRSFALDAYKLLSLILVVGVVYLFLPYDIIPDSAYGFLGLFDDVAMICGCLFCVAYATYWLVMRRAQARVAEQPQ
jgi:uncharacterized membrane protein YkvA (DUF1232 family)